MEFLHFPANNAGQTVRLALLPVQQIVQAATMQMLLLQIQVLENASQDITMLTQRHLSIANPVGKTEQLVSPTTQLRAIHETTLMQKFYLRRVLAHAKMDGTMEPLELRRLIDYSVPASVRHVRTETIILA